ncbi:hypothetical protein TW81_02725 [Vibrio galatheae]|uniref:Uncharacterized protein n=1 Tax=Vibrio galatheae TaxID=579748 RepID=A0A0F4NS75_9VIBR|nr:hypothetical protein [Vibrio galatheae]KJY84921.1 hypothetical protein TW81_02725 [Vibrio galatheae]
MLLETIERVNRLRQQAMSDPEFIQSAKAHEKALNDQDHHFFGKKKSAKQRKDRSLADIYQQAEFAQRAESAQH